MKNNVLLPSHPHGQKLAQIFSYGWNWIEAPNEGKPNWETKGRYPIKPRTLWNRWQDASTLIGVRFGSSTAYAMLDVDAESPYRDRLWDLDAALETIGIESTIHIQSSWSGGAHIYIPLAQAFPTFSVACAVKQCLEAQGFTVAPGQLEIFPNEKSYGKSWIGEFFDYNAHRLPLQPGSGSYLLGEPPADDQLSKFLAFWHNAVLINSLNRDEFAEALCIARSNRRHRRRKASSKAEQWKEDLEAIIAEGWTGPGQTNQLIKEIATHGRVFEGLAGTDLAAYVFITATTRPGYEEHCRHQDEIGRRCDAWCRAVEKFYWPLGTEPLRETKRLELVLVERAAEAQARIKAAFDRLRDELAGLSIKAMVVRLCKEAACSAATLYKYRSIWHPHGTAPTPPPPLPEPPQPQQPVTHQPEGTTGDMASILAVIRESLRTAENQGVTRQGGENEVCNLKSAPLKNLPSKGKEGGVGGRKGFPQAQKRPKPVENSPGSGWLPRLDWKQGAVGDV